MDVDTAVEGKKYKARRPEPSTVSLNSR